MALSKRDKAILDYERSWWTEPGVKEVVIRQRFELSATRYYGILAELLESAEAMERDPLLVRRLRRQRDQRRRVKFEGSTVDERPGR